jgi:hypothetical protein
MVIGANAIIRFLELFSGFVGFEITLPNIQLVSTVHVPTPSCVSAVLGLPLADDAAILRRKMVNPAQFVHEPKKRWPGVDYEPIDSLHFPWIIMVMLKFY